MIRMPAWISYRQHLSARVDRGSMEWSTHNLRFCKLIWRAFGWILALEYHFLAQASRLGK